MVTAPECKECNTDAHLLYTGFTGINVHFLSYGEKVDFSAEDALKHHEITYKCQVCGTHEKVTVPGTWLPPRTRYYNKLLLVEPKRAVNPFKS